MRSVLPIAEDAVLQVLNTTAATPAEAERRASDALKPLEVISAAINASWPDEYRLHFTILNVLPALVVKVSILAEASFFVVGAPEKKVEGQDQLWKDIGGDDLSAEHPGPQTQIDPYPLHRGPSGHARFVVRYRFTGCAGNGIGLAYEAFEWNPAGIGEFDQIIRQEGALGIDDNVRGFPQIGKLRTEGPTITLPYCWFSAIDTWDNPSLCAVDTYDVSRDHATLQSRRYNRADLLPVARAIEYAEKRDYRAVAGYCASPAVARKLVRELPPGFVAGDLDVKRTAQGKERAQMGFPSPYEFDLELRDGRWEIAGFKSK